MISCCTSNSASNPASCFQRSRHSSGPATFIALACSPSENQLLTRTDGLTITGNGTASSGGGCAGCGAQSLRGRHRQVVALGKRLERALIDELFDQGGVGQAEAEPPREFVAVAEATNRAASVCG